MSDIVWSNVLMFSVVASGVLIPVCYFTFRLLKIFDANLVAYLSRKNRFLSGIVSKQYSSLRMAEMDLSKTQLENSKLKSERYDLVKKIDDAINRVDFIDEFFSQFFSSLDFEIIMGLVDAYPGTLSTKELSRLVEVSSRKTYSAADRLFRQKWLNKSKTKTFPKTCLWSLKHDKFDILAQIFE